MQKTNQMFQGESKSRGGGVRLKHGQVRGERVVRLVYFQTDGPCAVFLFHSFKTIFSSEDGL